MRVSRIPSRGPEIFASIQGEGASAGTPSVFVRLALCNLRCSWCFVPETPVLMADWSWKAIGEIEAGDRILSIQREVRRGARPKLAVSAVTRVLEREAPTVWVNEHLRCTPDHRFWISGRNAEGCITHAGWRRIDRSLRDHALFTADPHDPAGPEFERGWLAGTADGDGCFRSLRTRGSRRSYRRFRLALDDETLLSRALTFAAGSGFVLRRGRHQKARGHMPCLWLTNDAETRRFEAWLSRDLPHDAWWAGYLSGTIDAEGSFSHGVFRIGRHSIHGQARSRIVAALRRLRIRHTEERTGLYVHRSRGQAWRVLSLSRPAKRSILQGPLGHHPHSLRAIHSIESSGARESVIDLTTTAGSFIATGYVVKNCDTPYTWDWSRYALDEETTLLDIDEILDRVMERAGEGIRNVVVTGGEPLVQRRALVPLVARLKEEGFRIEVETNGTLLPLPGMVDAVDQWNVSPKTTSSGNRAAAREKPAVLEWFARRVNAWWKFVIASPADIPEVNALVSRYSIPGERVFLMPEGTDAGTLMERSRWLSDVCEETGFRLGPRLQVMLWGAERGR